jgi:hypothetical protein
MSQNTAAAILLLLSIGGWCAGQDLKRDLRGGSAASGRATAAEGKVAKRDAAVKILSLANADASKVAGTLRQVLRDEELRAVRIAVYAPANKLILRGDSEVIDILEAIVLQLDEGPPAKK